MFQMKIHKNLICNGIYLTKTQQMNIQDINIIYITSLTITTTQMYMLTII